jgi:hypothetical protein
MSFRQKTALLSALALLAAYGWYFAQVASARAAGPLGGAAMLGLVLPTILAVVTIQIVGAVLIAIFSGERQEPMDERERALSANSIRGAYAVLLVGGLAASASVFFGLGAVDIANVALLAVVAAEIVRYGGYVFLHRLATR